MRRQLIVWMAMGLAAGLAFACSSAQKESAQPAPPAVEQVTEPVAAEAAPAESKPQAKKAKGKKKGGKKKKAQG